MGRQTKNGSWYLTSWKLFWVNLSAILSKSRQAWVSANALMPRQLDGSNCRFKNSQQVSWIKIERRRKNSSSIRVWRSKMKRMKRRELGGEKITMPGKQQEKTKYIAERNERQEYHFYIDFFSWTTMLAVARGTRTNKTWRSKRMWWLTVKSMSHLNFL